MFNLAAPPGFRGLDTHKPLKVYHRHLPHWRQPGATYFVTFRQADALPKEKLDYLKRLRADWERTHPAPRSNDDWEAHSRDLFRHVESWLDAGHGSCLFRQPRHATELADAILNFQEQRYLASAWAIMPNHCHLVIQPFQGWELEGILRGLKGTVARRVNTITGQSGALWQQESYDRIIRDDEHLWKVIQCIGRNPERASLPRNQWNRWIHPEWHMLGWRFAEEVTSIQ